MKFVIFILGHPVCFLLFFLVFLSCFFFYYSLFLSLCVYVFVSSIIFHFSRSFSRCFLCNSFISSRVSLDRIQGFFPSLFLSLYCTSFHDVALSLPKLFSMFSFSPFLSLSPSFSLFIIHLPPLTTFSLPDSSLSFRTIAQYLFFSCVTVYSVFFLLLLPFLFSLSI